MTTNANMIFSDSQLETLRASFATTGERISLAHADRLLDLLDRCDPVAMGQLAGADIKFLSSAARGRVMRAAR